MQERVHGPEGPRTSRRQFVRAAGIGLSLPFALTALSACSLGDDDDDGDAERGGVLATVTPPNYTGSDSTHHGTGAASPVPAAEIQPFQRYDPFLAPVSGGPKQIEVVARDATLHIAAGVGFAEWTFDGTVPGPVHRVVEGDTVDVTFRVDPNAIPHSLDFHSAKTPPEVNYRTVLPGEELRYSFEARYPGAFMYHCGTPPIVMHIAAGMYGAMIVDPKDGWLPAQEICLVQSEFYLMDGPGGVKVTDYNKMMGNGIMDYVTFNGYVNQYVENPITVRTGELIRIFVVNAGPNVWSSFHVVGSIFDVAYPNANPANRLVGQQSISIGPGDGACVELVLDEPGTYPFVNHSFGHASHGAVGLLVAE
jgi:nitrite reductase (NO-forming)